MLNPYAHQYRNNLETAQVDNTGISFGVDRGSFVSRFRYRFFAATGRGMSFKRTNAPLASMHDLMP